ncbi:MAG: AAA family ATPase [Proteobacteria bacterium]|nr:AAA family ATPase [Pseudomonadota bacterium]
MADGMIAPKKRTKLLAVSPEIVEPKKPKVLVYGPPGVGKTWAALDFPSVYYIDTEGGADLAHYRSKLKSAGGMYFGPDQGSLDFETVIGQVQALATEEHPYKTVVFDSITKLFQTAISEEAERLGDKDAFGASKKPAVRQMGRLIRWMNRADMNAIVIAHQKDEWGKNDKGVQEVIGHTFDGWEKLAFELHLVLRISKIGVGDNARRFAHIGKSRLTGFPEGERIDWSYASFAERYGRDVIEKEVTPITLATPDQVAELMRLLDAIKLPDGVSDKWLTKAGVDGFDEMDAETIEKCLAFLKSKLP